MSTWEYCDNIWNHYKDAKDGYAYGVDKNGYAYPTFPLEKNR